MESKLDNLGLGLVMTRRFKEKMIVDLKPLIDLAVDAAGPSADLVRKALTDFLEGSDLIVIQPLERSGEDRIRMSVKAPRGIGVDREERHESMRARRDLGIGVDREERHEGLRVQRDNPPIPSDVRMCSVCTAAYTGPVCLNCKYGDRKRDAV